MPRKIIGTKTIFENIPDGFEVTENNKIFIADNVLTPVDYKVLGFSSTDTVSGLLVIGSDLPLSEYKNLKGKILILPYPADLPKYEYDAYGVLRSLCLDAADEGAVAVIFISNDKLPGQRTFFRFARPPYP